MQIKQWRAHAISALVLGVIGLAGVLVWSYRITNIYESTAEMRIRSGSDTDFTQQQKDELFTTLKNKIQGEGPLSRLILAPSLNLYRVNPKATSIKHIVERMRKDLGVTRGRAPNNLGMAFRITYDHTDPYMTRAVVQQFVTALFADQPGRSDLLVAPKIPEWPVYPNRPLWSFLGFLGGAVIGGGGSMLFRRGKAS